MYHYTLQDPAFEERPYIDEADERQPYYGRPRPYHYRPYFPFFNYLFPYYRPYYPYYPYYPYPYYGGW